MWQLEGFDAEMETLATGGGKKRGKPPPRIAHLEEAIGRHKTHVGRLEALMRLLDNGAPLHTAWQPYMRSAGLTKLASMLVQLLCMGGSHCVKVHGVAHVSLQKGTMRVHSMALGLFLISGAAHRGYGPRRDGGGEGAGGRLRGAP